MARPADDAATEAGPDDLPVGRRRADVWKRRLLVTFFATIVVVLGYFAAAAFVPRWWAQRVAEQVQGSFNSGVLWGLVYGIACTAVPILIVVLVMRSGLAWKVKTIVGVVALVITTPNLMTLAIAAGTGNGSHAGQRILDVEAPAFRGATLGGVLGGAALAVAILMTTVLLRRRRARDRLATDPETDGDE